MTMGLTCRLEGDALTSLDDVYDSLARDLAFPAYFGRNLDALWDVLTHDLPGPARIELTATEAARAAIGPKFDRLIALLKDAAAERDDLTLVIKTE